MKTLPNSIAEPAKVKKFLVLLIALSLLFSLMAVTVYATATNNDVAGTMQNAFDTYVQPQIVKAVNHVVLPIIDGVLIISLVVTLVLAGINYKHNPGGHFEWHIPAILFAGLVVCITAPLWMWTILGL